MSNLRREKFHAKFQILLKKRDNYRSLIAGVCVGCIHIKTRNLITKYDNRFPVGLKFESVSKKLPGAVANSSTNLRGTNYRRK